MALHLYPAYSSAWHNSGTARYGMGKPDEALKALLKAEFLDPDRSTTLNTIGDIHFDRREYGSALDYYEKSIKADPGFYPPYYSIGQLLKLSGDNEKAALWIRKAEELKLRKK
jgi:tetratricopeptide (TPR) repeat protein